ncbi:hypothetical protein WJX81_001132 [Elliptochloris bilobata]|uniref:Uncharacterized protein n=1 Tax=Elliptochloris bilobata TaxID=381761 RepID=A0AAW1S510_9CHLO
MQVQAGSCDTPLLPFTNILSDGGAYDEEFGPHNLFQEESQICYCSLRRSSINVTAQLEGLGCFMLASIELRTPSLGYTSPLGQAILFTSFGRPDVAATKRFDEVFSEREYREQVAEMQAQPPERPSSPGLEVPTPASFVYTSSDRVTAQLDVPRAGRWILLKLLRPREPSGDNIDVQFVGCRGWRGARCFGAADAC